MNDAPAVLQAILFQSRACRSMGSPLNATMKLKRYATSGMIQSNGSVATFWLM